MRIRSVLSFKDSDLRSVRGFTLIEIAIGMLILGLFIAGAAQAFYLFLVSKANADLDTTVKTVQEALRDFVADDPNDPSDAVRYPCPAPLGAQVGSANYGREVCPANFANPGAAGADIAGGEGVFVVNGVGGEKVLVGTVPTSTLQIGSRYMLDPYHNRMLYAVSLSHTAPGAMIAATPPADAVEVIDPSNNTQVVDFILLSHGKDGAGSYTSEGMPHGFGCRGTTQGDAQNCTWQNNNRALFRDQNGHSLAINDQYYDDRTVYSLASGSDSGWWRATDNTGQDITHINPGNVGIGTGNPGGKLTIVPDGDGRGLEIHSPTAGNTHFPWRNNWNYIAGHGLILRDKDHNEKMRFDHGTGNLGIGTNAPKAKLDVQGGVKIGTVPNAECKSATVGLTRYDSVTDAMQYCAKSGGVGASGKAIPGWRPYGGSSGGRTIMAVHSQRSSVPTCPAGWNRMWTGYSYSHGVGAHGITGPQDLAGSGSCLREFRPMPIIECEIQGANGRCEFNTVADLSYWLSARTGTGDIAPILGSGVGSFSSLISRCSVCEKTADVVTVHSQRTSIPSCPAGTVSLWTGYSYSHGEGGVGGMTGPQDLSRPGSCLREFRAMPIIECFPVGAKSRCDYMSHGDYAYWLSSRTSFADVGPSYGSNNALASHAGRCNVCEFQ